MLLEMLELCLIVVSRVLSGSIESIIMQDEDLFDAVVRVEEAAYHRGLTQGRAMAEKRDRQESYDRGYARGQTIGRELGFYLGVVESLENEPLHPTHKQLLNKLALACQQAQEDPSELPAVKGKLKHLLKALKATAPRWVSDELY